MLFEFLTYLRPVWFFNLKPQKDYNYFPHQEDLKAVGFELSIDSAYQSVDAQERDLAWQAFQLGYIQPNELKGISYWQRIKLPLTDEYRFIRKNFHSAWVYYVLMCRLLSFKQPLRELKGFLNTRRVQREVYHHTPFQYKAYDTFQSTLMASNPLVSVIIPTLNRYVYLKDVLKDLEQQTYKNFEVIVVDQTDDFQKDFYKGWNLDLTYWFQKEKALWKARNEAIKASKGEYVLLYDDDSLVSPDWISEHLKALDFFQADISSGVSISVVGSKVPAHYSYFRWSDQLDTGNVLLKKSIFRTIGLFDRQFEKQRMGDGEFGLRAYLYGYKNISNPKAKRVHLKVAQGGLRQMGSWDGWRPKSLLAPRPIPSVLYLSRRYYGNRASRYFILKSVLPSLVPMKYKSQKALALIAFLLLPILLPLVLYQVLTSWRLASKKIQQGPIIEFLKL